MPRIAYEEDKMNGAKLALVKHAISIIRAYSQQGLDLTLRQLYYQFVSKDLFPESWADPKTGSTNNERSYKKLGDIIADARMCGLIDWNTITDRTRNLRKRAEWGHPSDLIEVCADQFRMDRWKDQEHRPEVWIEKDALVGVVEGVCEENGVAYFSCRGYTSVSEIWVAAQRLGKFVAKGQKPVILHFGDHDPSGIDMTRDIRDRLNLFISHDLVRDHGWDRADVVKRLKDGWMPLKIQRMALNMDQVEEYDPPPNPAKVTDSRAAKYIEKFGEESWELDALDPNTIIELVRTELEGLKDDDKWADSGEKEDEHRETLRKISDKYDDVVAAINKEEDE